MVRRWVILAMVGFAGCESLKHLPQSDLAPVVAESGVPRTQDPLPTTETELPPDSLTLAAECLGRGDQANAAVHLEAHVLAHPEQVMFRAQLADLLLKLGRDEAAKVHYEEFAAEARRLTGAPRNHLVHVHTQLMELALRSDDRFAEVYHRGAGLLLLAAEQQKAVDRDDEFAEEMLCKALRALSEARRMRPDNAEVRARLAEVYERMGNRRAADAEKIAAGAGVVPTGSLPPLR
jgi:tetratricopeptide (TPR) repeat protein